MENANASTTNSSATAAVDQFIVATDPNDNEPVEIQLSTDGTLPLSTLEHAFPGAYGLKYKNPATGAKRIVSLDESGKHFQPPPDGWNGKVFELTFRPNTSINTPAAPVAITPTQTKNGVVQEENKVAVAAKRKSELEQTEKQTSGSDEGEQFKQSKKAKQSAQPDLGFQKPSVDLIVMGLPFDLEEWAFEQYFDQFGSVQFSEIKRKKSGESRGFGFVRMYSYSDQVRVLSQPHHMIGGRECSVRISSTEKGIIDNLNNSLTAHPRIFIGNLSRDIGKERIREFFMEHIHRFDKTASITDMYYPSKPFRNFAFMTINSSQAAVELLRQSDYVIDEATCVLSLAEQKNSKRMEEPLPSPQQHQQPQPWAFPMVHQQKQPPPPQQQQYGHGFGGEGGYGYGGPPMPYEMAPDPRWSGGRGPPPPQFDDYPPPPPRGGPYNDFGPPPQRGGQPPPHPPMGYEQNSPMNYPPRQRTPLPFDPREDVDFDAPHFQQQHVRGPPPPSGPRGNGADVWMAGGAPRNSMGPRTDSNLSMAQAEAVLNQLPTDAVGQALKMLQTIISGQQQQQQGSGQGRSEERSDS